MTLASVDSPGKKLHDKRLEKQMSVADAARLTHIRPDRIIDLEKDDYSNFPSLAYARGFLLIYARLLEVDVAQAAVRLENSNPVDIGEYEYLSGKPAPLTRSLGTGRRVVAVLFGIASIFVAAIVLFIHIINTSKRLDDASVVQKDQQLLHATPAPTAIPEPTAAASATPEPVIVKAEPVATPAATPAAPVINEVVLHPLKKAWVKIKKDSADSEPVYEDWLYPDSNGLTLHGEKFFIELNNGVGNGDDVEITKNGKPVTYNSPGVVVQ
jgi:cytoskeletal protein RodZ